MKIAFIGQKGIPAKLGGVERHVEELAAQLVEKNHEVFVYVRNNYTDKNTKTYRGIKLIHIPSISTKHLDAISHTFFSILHALFQPYDVIHFHSIGPTSLSFIIKFLKPKTRLVATYHCQDYMHKKWGKFAQMCLRLGEFVTCKVPDATIAVSKSLQKFIKENYKSGAIFIPNGFKAQYTNSTSEIEKWNLIKGGYILAVSRLIRHKGVHYLIEAFKNLEDKNLTQGKKLVIVGEGFYTDDYVNHLKNISEGRKNIIFTGAQAGEALSQLFSNAYIFVHPSDSEGLSIALLEAMGYGKAVLVSDIQENLEPISDSGFSFKKGSVKDLESKLLSAINDFEAVRASGEKLKLIAQKEYDWTNIANSIDGLYKELVNN